MCAVLYISSMGRVRSSRKTVLFDTIQPMVARADEDVAIVLVIARTLIKGFLLARRPSYIWTTFTLQSMDYNITFWPLYSSKLFGAFAVITLGGVFLRDRAAAASRYIFSWVILKSILPWPCFSWQYKRFRCIILACCSSVIRWQVELGMMLFSMNFCKWKKRLNRRVSL